MYDPETVRYDKAGRITEKALGATGERVTYSYNADGTVKQSIRTKQGNIVYSERYEYDKNGNRVFSEENGEIRDYWYDENNRLKKIRIGGEGGDYEIYEFDGFGNISTKVEIDGNYIDKTQYSYDNRNRLISSTDGEESTAYEYDKNGNLKKKVDFYGIHSKTETYTYTAFGELKTAEGDNFFAEYYYGADGFRSGKKVNGVSTGYVYDGMYIVGESVDGVNYTYSRGTGLLGYTSSLGETVYYRTNVHGDVKELVNVFGESLERYDYNAYGAEDEDYNPFRRMFGKKNVHNPFRYTGEYTDSETGLVYLRNRMYDPETGRFISEDPIRDGLNWYAYCEGNPVMFIDPSGEIPVETVIDLFSIGWSLIDFVNEPSLVNFGFLAWDVAAAIIPYAPGSYVAKPLKAGTKILSKSDDYVKSGVWAMKAFDRGYEIERALGGMANNFPTIDKFVRSQERAGITWLSSVTSIKSIDVTASSYKTGNTLKNLLKKYVDDLVKFAEANYKGRKFMLDPNASKILEIAVPPVEMSSSQSKAFQEIIDYATEKGIEVLIKIVE